MKKFRWCFIGCGTLASKVAKELLASANHEIVSCYTRSYDKALTFAHKYGGVAYQDALEAINDKNVDAVYIVTPHNAHFKFAKLALESKKPVLLEKPFTVFSKDTDELIALAKQNNTYIVEAMWTWFNKCANQVKEWVENKAIGEIQSAYFTYHLNSIKYAPRVGDYKRAGGALLDITIYPITYAYVLFGKPIKIDAFSTINNKIDTKEELVFHYDNFDVTISASIIDYHGLEKMKIVGNKGKITSYFYHASRKVKLITKNRRLSFKDKTTYLTEFDLVSKEIQSGLKESQIIPFKQTVDIMRLLDEIRHKIGLEYSELE